MNQSSHVKTKINIFREQRTNQTMHMSEHSKLYQRENLENSDYLLNAMNSRFSTRRHKTIKSTSTILPFLTLT